MHEIPAMSSPGTVFAHGAGNVALILLNYEGAADTLACLQAVVAMPDKPGRIIVVDNGSQDDSVAAIRAWLHEHGTALNAELLPLSENTGYAAGNNAGIRLALQDSRITAFWLLNNDTEPQPGALEALCLAFEPCQTDRHGRVGMVGSTLVYAHAPNVLQCAAGYSFNRFFGTTTPVHGGKPLHATVCNTSSAGSRARCTTADSPQTPQGVPDGVQGPLAVGESSSLTDKESRDVTPWWGRGRSPYSLQSLAYICGASLLVRREVVEAIGLLAEEYFLYYEDAEYGLRAKRAGYGLAWAPESVVLHKEGASSGAASKTQCRAFQRSKIVDYLSLRNRIYLMRTYFPLTLLVAIVGYAGVIANRIRRGQADRIPLVLRALRDGLMKRMGPPVKSAQKKKTNVLFITARADFGGGPEHLWQLLQHLPDDIAPHVACPRDFPYYDRFSELVGLANMVEIPHRKFTLGALLCLRQFCRTRGIMVVHSHGKGAGLYSRLLTLFALIPCVHTFHGVHMAEYGSLKRCFYRLYERAASWITRTGIAVSRGEKERILQEGLMSEKTLRLIPNGVPIPVQYSMECAGPPYRVVSLSRFDYQKNSAFLIEVLDVLRQNGRMGEFQFELIGDGVEKEEIARLAEVRGVAASVCFIRATRTPHVYFPGALCYFSSSRWEGMPLGVLEAMAHGLPPVASDVVGNRDAVTHEETGLLYHQGDAVAAAAALCCIANDATQRKLLGERARMFVQQQHDVQHMAVQIATVLQHAHYEA